MLKRLPLLESTGTAYIIAFRLPISIRKENDQKVRVIGGTGTKLGAVNIQMPFTGPKIVIDV